MGLARAVLGSEPSSGAVPPGPRYLRAGEARGALNFLGPRFLPSLAWASPGRRRCGCCQGSDAEG